MTVKGDEPVEILLTVMMTVFIGAVGFCCATFPPETAERLQVINVLLLIVMESLLTSIV